MSDVGSSCTPAPAGGFTAAGYGDRQVGFGQRPAVLVVDFQRSFTDKAYPMGRSGHVDQAVENTARLLQVARAQGLPVATCSVGWGSPRDMAYWKVSSVYQDMFYGDAGMELDPRIAHPSDFHFIKGAPSIFFGTPLQTFLVRQCVDTVIVTGCTTSGCVRASIVDAFSYGYRVIVPEPCCGDQEQSAHQANLADVGRRYADVLTLDQVLAAINGEQQSHG